MKFVYLFLLFLFLLSCSDGLNGNGISGVEPNVCTFAQGNKVVTAWFDDDKLRIDSGENHGIYLKEVMYLWSGSSGQIVHLTEFSAKQKLAPSKSDILKKEGVSCKFERIDRNLFIPPVHIVFEDLTDMMLKFAKIGERQKYENV